MWSCEKMTSVKGIHVKTFNEKVEMKDSNYRYSPRREFPAYVFVPGKNPHPKKSGGHMEGLSDPVVSPINPDRPQESDDLRFGLDLYNFGFFWESHVFFEALWNSHGRVGSIADFLKALIKLGAAGVKDLIDQPKFADEHRDRARELFEAVRTSEGEEFMGFDLQELSRCDLKRKTRIDPEWS
jgi:hypothetical protein